MKAWRWRMLAALALMPAATALAQQAAPAMAGCGERVRIETHDGTTTHYALAGTAASVMAGTKVALVLLPGGGGHLDLDDKGCPRALLGNFLVRALPLLHAAGFVTALVDSPSDHQGADGLAGFRTTGAHADDLGRVIAILRARTGAAIWLVGTSRGTISATNAATKLAGTAAPDGLVLTSALTAGNSAGKLPWVAQSVFDLPLEAIRMPLLVVGHANDKCVRSPARRMEEITARARSTRMQAVVVTGGPGTAGPASVDACAGRTPHGFEQQEAEVVAGIARFIGGGRF